MNETKYTVKEIKDMANYYDCCQNNAIKRKDFDASVEYGQKRIKWQNMLLK